jgi:hypothetical protein
MHPGAGNQKKQSKTVTEKTSSVASEDKIPNNPHRKASQGDDNNH